MLATSPRSPPGFNPEHLQFYTIELSECADGNVFVAVVATLCPREEELCDQHLYSTRAPSLDAALAAIKDNVLIGRSEFPQRGVIL
jgi:hypothetical protein